MNLLKKRGFAVAVTIVLILAAVVIGRAKGPGDSHVSYSDGSGSWYVYDDANVLSSTTERTLRDRNQQLDDSMGVVVACVTCNYGKDDLYSYAMNYAETIGLGQYDFIVVLDISGENYWLIQGSGLVDLFSDDDCAAYAWDYMEEDFAAGNYDDALLNLTQALSRWYSDHY